MSRQTTKLYPTARPMIADSTTMRDPKSSTTAAFCEIKKSCKDCDLCDIILQAFKKTDVQDKEITRELQIILHTSYNKIKVYYNTGAKE